MYVYNNYDVGECRIQTYLTGASQATGRLIMTFLGGFLCKGLLSMLIVHNCIRHKDIINVASTKYTNLL